MNSSPTRSRFDRKEFKYEYLTQIFEFFSTFPTAEKFNQNHAYEIFKLYNLALLEGEYYEYEAKVELAKITDQIEALKVRFKEINLQNIPIKYLLTNIDKVHYHFLFLLEKVNKPPKDSSYIDIFYEDEIISLYYNYRKYLDDELLRLASKEGTTQAQTPAPIDNDEYKRLISQALKIRDVPNYINNVNLQYLIFLINFSLAEFDEGYLCSQGRHEELLKLWSKLSFINSKIRRSYSKHILSILLQKAEFLIYKILKRAKTTAQDGEKNFSITLEDGKKEFTIDALEQASHPHFDELYKKVQAHYEFDQIKIGVSNEVSIKELVSKIKEYVQANKSEKEPELAFSTIHLCSKILRVKIDNAVKANSSTWPMDEDTVNVFVALKKKLIAKLKDLHEEAKADYPNIDAYETTLFLVSNVLFKNDFELYIRGLQPTNTSIFAIENKINAFKTHYIDEVKVHGRNNDNVYIFKHFGDFTYGLLVKLDSFIEDGLLAITKDNFKEITELINFLLTYYNENQNLYLKFLNKTEDTKQMPLYLRLKECVEETTITVSESPLQIDDISLFLDSSYILPSNYQYLRSKVLEFSSKIRVIEANIFSRLFSVKIDNLGKDFEDDKKKLLDDIEKKARESQFTAIQLIGFFIGVVTFIIGSITIVPKFQGGNTLFSIIAFMWCFSSSLVLFSLILSVISHPDGRFIIGLKKGDVQLTFAGRWRIISRTRFFAIFVLATFMLIISSIAMFYSKDIDEKAVEPKNDNKIEITTHNGSNTNSGNAEMNILIPDTSKKDTTKGKGR